jgi:hypothetical protein
MKPLPQGVLPLFNTATERMVTLGMSPCIVLLSPSSVVPSFQPDVYKVGNAITQLETHLFTFAHSVIEK